MEFLFLVVLTSEPSNKGHDQVQQIIDAICTALGLKKSEVFCVKTEDEKNSGFSRLTLQLPKTEEKINQLQFDALNKKSWLTDLGVVELKVNNNSSIIIEKKKEEKQSKPLPRTRSILAIDPNLKVHCDMTFDTVLAIELSQGIDVKTCKRVLEQCEASVKSYHSHHSPELCKFRLAAIRFGNHSVIPTRLRDQQQISFLDKELSNDLNITSKIKPEALCGGMENSGLADALSKVYSLSSKMHREATKLCIVICFITRNSSNPEHYRCSLDHDVIKLGHALATHAIPLYIIGIDLERRQASSTPGEENYLLSGLTAITGGRYFQIKDIRLLTELIHCIIKENHSIEKNMGTVNDVVIAEINKQYGDVNEVHLTDHLHNSLHLRSCEIDCIKQRGIPLTLISQISERVSWADNLDDAIAGIKSLKKHLKMPEKARALHSVGGPVTLERFRREKEFVTERQTPDKEVSARLVRRQIERSAYYRPITV